MSLIECRVTALSTGRLVKASLSVSFMDVYICDSDILFVCITQKCDSSTKRYLFVAKTIKLKYLYHFHCHIAPNISGVLLYASISNKENNKQE